MPHSPDLIPEESDLVSLVSSLGATSTIASRHTAHGASESEELEPSIFEEDQRIPFGMVDVAALTAVSPRSSAGPPQWDPYRILSLTASFCRWKWNRRTRALPFYSVHFGKNVL